MEFLTIKSFIAPSYGNAMLFGIFSCVISWITMPWVIRLSNKRNILAQPNKRSEHSLPTPALGGLGIFIGFVPMYIIWSLLNTVNDSLLILSALLLLFIIGYWDDLKDLKPSVKLIVQLFASLIITVSGTRITSLGGMMGIAELSLSFQYLLSILVIIGVTNAINLIDGINGLAAGIVIMNTIILGCIFISLDQFPHAILSFSIAGSLLGFLRFNFGKAKIFMGDSGSLVIGFSLAYLGISLLNVGSANQSMSSIVIVFGILILPVFDTLRVFTIRLLKKTSPFSADRNHLHHLLIKTGLNHSKASLIMYTANICIILIAYLLSQNHVSIATSIVSLTGAAIILSELLTIKRVLMIRTRLNKLFILKKSRSSFNHLLNNI